MKAGARAMCLGLVMMAWIACGQQRGQNPGAGERATAAQAQLDLAIAVSRDIRARPIAMDSILTSHGLTRRGLDSLMYGIAADSAQARAYTEAGR